MIRKLAMVAAAIAAFCVTGIPASAQPRHEVSWSGTVDETAVVYIHGHQARVETLAGKPVNVDQTESFGFLPRRPVNVYIADWNGRGRVKIVQQPGPGNDYTAAVRIHDRQGGAGHYHFDLAW
jgi:hypothetical protein